MIGYLGRGLAGCCAVVASIAAMAGCRGQEDSIQPRAAVLVTVDDPSAPRDCRPAAAAEILARFADSVSGRSGAGAEDAFSSEPRFEWYSSTVDGATGDGRHMLIEDRTELGRYFTMRRAARETLTVREVASSYDADLGQANFGTVLTRTATDIPTRGSGSWPAAGKGAIACDDGKLIALSIGMTIKRRAQPPQECPGDLVRGRILACARR